MKSKKAEEFIIISGEKELIEEFKEDFKINTKQTGEESLILNEIDFKKLKKEWIKRIQDRCKEQLFIKLNKSRKPLIY